jgi:tetratricopeptide (TPR) repeat protein
MKKLLLFVLLCFHISGYAIGQKASDYLKAAIVSTNNKDYKKAIAFCDMALSANNTYNAAYFHRGYNKFLLKDYKGAIVDFTVCIDLNSDYLDAYLYRGLCNQREGNNMSATRDYNLARQINAVETLAFVTGNLFRFGLRND